MKNSKIRVCFLTSEVFAFGNYGGFGKLIRDKGKELVKRGVEVYVVMKQIKKGGQRTIEDLDGMVVLGFPSYLQAGKFIKLVDADIYQSEEPIHLTLLAEKLLPNKKHIVVFQDPRDKKDYEDMYQFPELRLDLLKKIFGYYKSPVIRKAAQNADARYCQAKFMAKKTKKMYKLEKEPEFLPNPVDIPKRNMKKADKPTVVFLARLDNYKRPWITLELAKKFPHVNFEICGKAHNDKLQEKYIKKYSKYKNIHFHGLVFGEEKSKILEKAWILINTSIHEGLPVAYIEAAAHKCAFLSCRNPDNFASNFGRYITFKRKNKPEEFIEPLKWLLEKDRWKKLGEKAQKYVKKEHETDKVIKQHIKIYKKIIENKNRNNE